jgi:parallel beta-helix repeat protein
LKKLLLALALLGTLRSVSLAQMGVIASALPPTYFNSLGTVAANAKLCTTATNTNTPHATYADSALTLPLPNPISLNAVGVPQTSGGASTAIYLRPAQYRFTLYAAGTGNTCNDQPVGAIIWQRDRVYDYGQIHGSGGGGVVLPSLDCANFTGATAGDQIHACLAALPSPGGSADASRIAGGAINMDVFSGITTSGELKLCTGMFTVSVPITIPSNWIIRGCGESTVFSAPKDLRYFIMHPGSSASAVLYVAPNASNVTIRDINVKGPYSGSGPSGTTFGIYAGDGATNITIRDNFISNASWSGIHLFTGNHMIVEGNRTTANAIDGIESWASDSTIAGNHSSGDGAAMNPGGGGCIEIIYASKRTSVLNNTCTSSRGLGIVLSGSGGGTNQDRILIQGNQIYHPAEIGILDQEGSTKLTVIANTIDSPEGSGTLGNGILLNNSTRFLIIGNTVSGAVTGNGPSGIQVDQACDGGTIANNIVYQNWVGLAITGSCGTNVVITVANNLVYGSTSGVDYVNNSTGDKVRETCNAFGGTDLVCSTTTASVVFANLPRSANGAILYCKDCRNPADDRVRAGARCRAGGHGAVARRENGHWVCD